MRCRYAAWEPSPRLRAQSCKFQTKLKISPFVVSRYKKGANVPTGSTEFQFKTGDLNFKSTSYDWLVIAGSKAKFKGDGTINGAGNYGFMLTAADSALPGGGESDTFRIKIWDKDNGDVVVYDSQMGDVDEADATTALGGGSIVIHKAK